MLIACPDCRRQYDAGPHEPGARLRCHCGTMMEVPKAVPRDARMVHCSACGAGLAAGATDCSYCGAGIGLAQKGLGDNCPSCFSRLVADARFCSSCGTSIDPAAIQHALATHDCPRCAHRLTESSLADIRYEQCTHCGGLWLDEAFVERLIRDRRDDRPPLPPSLAHREPAHRSTPQDAAAARTDRALYIACPVCEQMMNRHNFAGRSGVILDRCKGHGYWFDAEELERVITFVDGGGIEAAQRRDLDEAEQRARRLAARDFARSATPTLPVRGALTFGHRRRQPSLFDAVADFLGSWLGSRG